MALTREKKEKIVENLKERIKDQKIMIFAGFEGLKTKDFLELRRSLKSKASNLTVAKKTLMKLAFKDVGLDFDNDLPEKETAVIFGFEDEIIPSKTVFEFSKKNPGFKIAGGFMDGEFKSSEDIIILAKLPSREEILARFVGTVQSPISCFMNVLNGNIKGLINVLSAKAKT